MRTHPRRRPEPANARPRIERHRINDLPISVAIAVIEGEVYFKAATHADGRMWEATSSVAGVPGKFRQNVLARDLAEQLARKVAER